MTLKDQCLIVDSLARSVEALKGAPRCGGKLSRVAALLEAECVSLSEFGTTEEEGAS